MTFVIVESTADYDAGWAEKVYGPFSEDEAYAAADRLNADPARRKRFLAAEVFELAELARRRVA